MAPKRKMQGEPYKNASSLASMKGGVKKKIGDGRPGMHY